MNKLNENDPGKTDMREKKSTSYTGLGVALGASLGFIFGLLFMGDNLAVGIGIGVAIGLILGSAADARNRKR